MWSPYTEQASKLVRRLLKLSSSVCCRFNSTSLARMYFSGRSDGQPPPFPAVAFYIISTKTHDALLKPAYFRTSCTARPAHPEKGGNKACLNA
jgi:hypothetical protein